MATQEDKVNVGAIGTMAVVGALFVAGTAWALTALVRTEVHEKALAIDGYAATTQVNALRQAQQAQLTQGKLPIDRAEALVLSDLKRDPNTATAPAPVVAAPVDSAAPAGSGSAAPVDSAAPPSSASPAPSSAPAVSAAPTPAPAHSAEPAHH